MAAAKTPYHKGNLREKLLREAARIIMRDGIRALSMRGLGASLGASRMAAYHHFADKNELLAAVGQDGFGRLLDRFQRAAGDTPRERLRGILTAYVRFALEETEFFRLMFANLLHRPLHDRTAGELRPIDFSSPQAFAAFDALLSAVKACQREGVFRAGNPLLIAETLHSFVHGLARLAMDEHLKCSGGVEALLGDGLDTLFRGLGSGIGDGRTGLPPALR